MAKILSSISWKRFGRNDTNRSFQPSTVFNRNNASKIAIRGSVSPFFTNLGGDVWVGMTSDIKHIYAVTHNTAEINNGGYIFCVNKITLNIDWKITFESLSGVPGDYARGAPTYYKGRVYVATSAFFPYTWNPYVNVVQRFQPGPVPYPTYSAQKSVYCLDAATGLVLWSTPLGNDPANIKEIGDTDNFMMFTQQAIIMEADTTGDGQAQPLLGIGTSSIQSFTPWLVCSNNNPFGDPLYQWPEDWRFTDVGRFFILDALSGVLISTTNMGPDLLEAGNPVPSDAIRPGDSKVVIYHYVKSGDLNPIPPIYAGDQNITWVLQNGFNIPTPLDGMDLMDQNGAVVTLSGGAPVTSNLNLVTVNVNATFDAGTTNFTVNTVNYSTLDPATQLENSGARRSARILARLPVAHVLTELEARQLNYYGMSVWSSSPAVNYGNDKLAKEIYLATGQNHFLPADEALFFMQATGSLLDPLNNIAAASTSYQGSPSQVNLDAIRTAYRSLEKIIQKQLYLPISVRGNRNYKNSLVSINLRPGTVGDIIQAENTVAYDQWNLGIQLTPTRINSDGLVTPGVTDIQQYTGFPRGYDADGGECPQLFTARSLWPYQSFYNTSILPEEDYLILPTKGGLVYKFNLTDVNSGSTTMSLEYFKFVGNPGLLGGSNFGSASNNAPISYNRRGRGHQQVQDPRLFTCQGNGGENNAFNLSFQTGAMGANNPQAQNFFPVLDWYPLSQEHPHIEIYPIFRSYISALDTKSGKVVWEMPATPENTSAPWVTSLTTPSVTNDILIYVDGSGRIQMLNTLDGSQLNSIDIGTGGITAPIIEYKAVYVFSGRSSFAQTYPNSNYAPAQRLYKLTF